MKKIKPVLIIVAVALLVFGAIRLVKSKKEVLKKAPTPQKAPLPVKTALVHYGTLEISEHYLGTILPVEEANLSTRLSGYILRVTKYEGDEVKEGELLVEIEAKALYTKLASLKAALSAAQTEYLTRKSIFERNKVLLKHEAISQEAFELSKSALANALARVKQLKQEISATEKDLSYALIKAPFNGVVTKRFKNPGDLAMPGAPLLTIENPAKGYKILVKIPQEKAASLPSKAKAYLIFGSQQKTCQVYKVYPAVGPNALALVEIRTPRRPFGLPSGAQIGTNLVFSERKGFLVPLNALVPGKTKGLFVVKEDKLVFFPVTVLAIGKDKALVTGKLGENMPVVVGDPGLLLRLKPGQKVIMAKGGKTNESI
ncbi:efflux RND transporter periplasmic adaptor subunit [Thermodesulfatator atlanticus]|uniref:efflux RND transporter periplasmic adaptor subunit n=1 Tax=Thermodesulfatator atlanticus TaxID=501497 RepID=UPI0003B301D7|nr:efflux RND transporter periplasmic adaptor subunit [Thermodesulfatator atlanticus]